MTEARNAIAQAEQLDARQYAGAELDEARMKLELAERAIDQENMRAAEWLANEAEVTATLAAARTESAKAQEINDQLERAARALSEEMDRMGEPE